MAFQEIWLWLFGHGAKIIDHDRQVRNAIGGMGAFRGCGFRSRLYLLQKPPHFIVCASKGKNDAPGLNLEDQSQFQSNAHLEVVSHEYADAQSRVTSGELTLTMTLTTHE